MQKKIQRKSLVGICVKFNIDFRNARKKFRKSFFFDIIASELVALNCLYYADNACHRQAMF